MYMPKIRQIITLLIFMGLFSLACSLLSPQQNTQQAIPSARSTPSQTVVSQPSQTPLPTFTPTVVPTRAPPNADRVVGYYFPGSSPNNYLSDIPGELLTDIIYAFVHISPEGRCVFSDPAETRADIADLQRLKEQYPAVRILFSIVEDRNAGTFSIAVASDASRKTFVDSCVQIMHENGLDGIDIDWEFPNRDNHHPEERQNFTAMLTEFRAQLDAQGEIDRRPYLLTFAAPAGRNEMKGYELGKIHPLVDWINVMTYNFYDEYSATTNLDGALFPVAADPGNKSYNDDAVVQAYLAAGVPANKIMLGVNFYGIAWKGVPAAQNGLYQPHEGPFIDPDVPEGTWNLEGKISYQSLQQYYLNDPAWNRYWQDEAKMPWLYNAEKRAFISYYDAQSMTVKAEYIHSKQLAGVMIWQIGGDDPDHTLLKALAEGLLP